MAQSTIISISIVQIKRHGWLRCLVGGGAMFLTFPAFILAHLTLVAVLYQRSIRPLYGLPRVRWSDYVLLDRNRIRGLHWIDRLNCQFCGYANGLSEMINIELDYLSLSHRTLSLWRRMLALLTVLLGWPLWIIFDLFAIRLVYGGIISRALGMVRVSYGEASSILRDGDYGAGLPRVSRTLLRLWKGSALALSMALEQIESAWCPLRHIETRESTVVPEHHSRFFGASSLEELRMARNALRDLGGTVSPRRPGG